MRIYETHAHLDFDQYKSDRDRVLMSCFKAGVDKIINIGIDAESTEKGLKLCEKYPQIRVTTGYHPSTIQKYDENRLRELLTNEKVLALGEIGLDYYRMYNPAEIQKQVFEEQVKIAMELNFPLIVHDRDAHKDCFEILMKYKPKKLVFHCFSGDVHFAEKILEQGWHISITGVITYKNSNLDNVVRIIPRDKLLIETDCPYLSPIPYRGQRNTPEYLIYVIQRIADILKMSPRVIAEQTFVNAEEFFGF